MPPRRIVDHGTQRVRVGDIEHAGFDRATRSGKPRRMPDELRFVEIRHDDAAPFCAITSVKARPRPLAAPVTTATWFLMSNSSACFIGCLPRFAPWYINEHSKE